MSNSKLSVVVTRRLPEAVENRLSELFDAQLNETDTPFTHAQLVKALQTANILVPTLSDQLDAKTLAKAGSQLKLITNYGSGFDHIDIEAAKAHGIMVTNTPGLLSEDSADMTLALILTVMRRFKEGSAALQSGECKVGHPLHFWGHPLAAKPLR